MGATEEQMELVENSSMDHVSYTLVLFSLAFIVFLFANMLIHIYDQHTHASNDAAGSSSNGGIRLSRDRRVEEANIRAAEEFELDGLSSDDEDERLLKPGNGELSPSTVGRNNEPIAR
jgi:hypothetical protein